MERNTSGNRDMNKIYKKPSLRVADLDMESLLAGSPDSTYERRGYSSVQGGFARRGGGYQEDEEDE